MEKESTNIDNLIRDIVHEVAVEHDKVKGLTELTRTLEYLILYTVIDPGFVQARYDVRNKFIQHKEVLEDISHCHDNGDIEIFGDEVYNFLTEDDQMKSALTYAMRLVHHDVDDLIATDEDPFIEGFSDLEFFDIKITFENLMDAPIDALAHGIAGQVYLKILEKSKKEGE